MIDKVFLFEDEEWIVEQVLTYGYSCICRNLDTDEEKRFRTEFVEQCIKSYEDDLKAREKKYNAFHFEEDNEKHLLTFIVSSFCNNDLSFMDIDDLITLKQIKKKMNME